MTFQDVLTGVLASADYPSAKRDSFIRTFYDYLFLKLLVEIEGTEPQLYQKLMNYFNDPKASSQEVQAGLQEAYANPELKDKLDKVVEEVTGELADDVAKFATEEEKQKILNTLPQTI